MEDDQNDNDAGSPVERTERAPRISLAKIQSINQDSKIAIFSRPTRNSAMQVLDSAFPREAAMVFCDRIRRELLDDPTTKSFTITSADIESYKDVLAWIKDSLVEAKPAEFKNLNEDGTDCFKLYAQRILAAGYLGIPARDFAEALSKRMLKLAREKLMTWDDVELFYSDEAYIKADLSKIAGTSVFSAWWRAELDSEETPDQMSILADLRDDYPALDQDLHDLVEEKKEWMDKKREEKRAKREAEMAGGTGEDGGWNNDQGTTNGSGGWEMTGSGAQASGGWDSGGGDAWAADAARGVQATGGWDSMTGGDYAQVTADYSTGFTAVIEGGQENVDPTTYGAPSKEFNDGGFENNGDWADEVNQSDTNNHSTQQTYTQEAPTWSVSAPSSGW